VKVLDQYAKLCGTFYQSDLYANDARTKALIAKGVLNGGDESWPDNGTQRYDTLTTQPCPTTEPTAPPTTTPEVTPSPSTPLPSDSPTLPSQPSDSPSPTTPATVTSASPSTTKSVDVVTPVTEQKVTGTTTAPATEKRATNSLAMTGSETVMQWITIGALLLFVGVFAVLDARKMRKIAQKIK
jgi:outer membrane biosynthesis protein TonB